MSNIVMKSAPTSWSASEMPQIDKTTRLPWIMQQWPRDEGNVLGNSITALPTSFLTDFVCGQSVVRCALSLEGTTGDVRHCLQVEIISLPVHMYRQVLKQEILETAS